MLPEKWCCKITRKNKKFLHEWYVKNIKHYKYCKPEWSLGIGSYFHYPSYDGGHVHSTFKCRIEDYTEITFKEFLNQSQEDFIPLIFN